MRELTEFFALPGYQSAGVGRELLARAFPREGAERRTVIATMDTRALARYLKRACTRASLSTSSRFAFFMSDVPFGKFENYIFTGPPFFM